MYNSEDIIAAQATAPGAGAISVIRLSGEGCLKVFRRCVKDCPEVIQPWRAYLREVADEDGVFDQVIFIYFRSPHSYTGEDMVEISCHGGHYISQRMLHMLFNYGVRPAEPGEFTLRAFINNKVDLTQAEAVSEIIAAQSRLGNRNAMIQLRGRLSERVRNMRRKLVHLLAELEVEIEFPEDEPMEADYQGWSERLQKVVAEMDSMIVRGNTGRIVREGYRVVIAGPPNSGKSTLMNALLDAERAIVHPSAGTTRDVLKESVEIGGIRVWLSDTAGLRDNVIGVEYEGIRRAIREMEEADFVIYLFDLGVGKPDIGIANGELITVGNKLDIHPEVEVDCDLRISALRGDGLPALKEEIRRRAFGGGIEGAVIANERHLQSLRQASSAIQRALEIAKFEGETELMALEIRDAVRFLGEITGEDVTEDTLEAIFSRFCIGK